MGAAPADAETRPQGEFLTKKPAALEVPQECQYPTGRLLLDQHPYIHSKAIPCVPKVQSHIGNFQIPVAGFETCQSRQAHKDAAAGCGNQG